MENYLWNTERKKKTCFNIEFYTQWKYPSKMEKKIIIILDNQSWKNLLPAYLHYKEYEGSPLSIIKMVAGGNLDIHKDLKSTKMVSLQVNINDVF